MKESLAGPGTFTVIHALRPVRRRLGIVRIRAWALRGLAAGAIVALVLLGAAHLWSLPWAPLPLGVALMALGVLVGAAGGAWRWPSVNEAARVADRHFGLQDRLTTALEYHASTEPFPGLQRDEAGRRVDGLKLERSARFPLDWRESGGTGALIVAFVALLLVGGASPGQARVVVTAEQRHLQGVTATQVRQIARNAGQTATPSARKNPALHRLQLTLERLRRTLEHTATRAAALRAISATQAKLHHLAAQLHPVSKRSVAQLNSALAQSMTPQQRAAAASSDRKALGVAAHTLQKLATTLHHMTAIQRAHLARSLAQAANLTGDSHLQSALRQAASSLGYNDPPSAAKALQDAASALAQTPELRAAQSGMSTANRQLDSLKNAVSGASPSSGDRPTSGSPPGGASGKGAGQGNGSGKGGNGKPGGKGSGQGSSKGNATGKGNGAAAGTKGAGGRRASDPGAGSGAGSGGGAPGAHGAGGGRGGAGHTGQGRYTTVYVPYKQGKGPTTTQNGPTGAPQSGPIVPYQQVVSAYSQTAHQALDRANLPPALRSYVRSYFSTVSH